jgi:hypothetical protein
MRLSALTFRFPKDSWQRNGSVCHRTEIPFLLGRSFSSFPNMFGQVVQHSTYRTQVRVQQYGMKDDRL